MPKMHQMIIPISGFIVGIFLGSFIDCIANRSLTKTSFFGRSFCESCKKPLGVLELIPIISYLSLRGKCRHCHKRIGQEVWLLELLCGFLVAILFFLFFPANFLALDPFSQVIAVLEITLKLFILFVLVAIFITDIKSGLIPDRITYPSIVLFLVLLVITAIAKIGVLYLSLNSSVLGKYLLPPHSDYFYRHAIWLIEPIGYALLTGIGVGAFFLLLILLTRGRGMGGGDMKLGVFLGLSFGFPASLTLLVLSFFTGSLFGLFLLAFKKKKFGQTIPFGPFLSIAGITTLFWGERILKWYLNLKLN